MTIKELNKSNMPIVKVDKRLEKQADKVLFPEKLEKANEVLRSVGLPKPVQSKRSLNGLKKSRIERA